MATEGAETNTPDDKNEEVEDTAADNKQTTIAEDAKEDIQPAVFVPFDWETYLKNEGATATPTKAFFQPDKLPANKFKVGQLVLAPDKHATDLQVLCKIRLVHKCWIYIHIEGLDETHCRWLMCDDVGLAPVGPYDPSAKIDSRNAYPPTGLQPSFKRWIANQYQGKEDSIAPEKCFKAIDKKWRPDSNKFEVKQKLCAYDEKSFDGKLHIATVVEVTKTNVRLTFDGWPNSFDINVRYDSRNLFPISFPNKAQIETNSPRVVAFTSILKKNKKTAFCQRMAPENPRTPPVRKSTIKQKPTPSPIQKPVAPPIKRKPKHMYAPIKLPDKPASKHAALKQSSPAPDERIDVKMTYRVKTPTSDTSDETIPEATADTATTSPAMTSSGNEISMEGVRELQDTYVSVPQSQTSAPPTKRRRLGFFDPANRPMRPGQRAAAMKEQVTGVKDKVIGLLKEATEAAERETLSASPNVDAHEGSSDSNSSSSHKASKIPTTHTITRTPIPMNSAVVSTTTTKGLRPIAPRPPNVPPPTSQLQALLQKASPSQATVHPSMRGYKLVPVSKSTLESLVGNGDLVFAASGVTPAPRNNVAPGSKSVAQATPGNEMKPTMNANVFPVATTSTQIGMGTTASLVRRNHSNRLLQVDVAHPPTAMSELNMPTIHHPTCQQAGPSNRISPESDQVPTSTTKPTPLLNIKAPPPVEVSTVAVDPVLAAAHSMPAALPKPPAPPALPLRNPLVEPDYAPSPVKREITPKMEIKSINKKPEDRICEAFVDKRCRVGPFLNRDKVKSLVFYPQPYAVLQQRIIQDLINCAWVPKEVFDLIKGVDESVPSVKVLVDHEGQYISKNIPVFLSLVTTWLYINDVLLTLNACCNLITANNFACNSCGGTNEAEADPEMGDDGLPKNRVQKYKREYDVLKQLGAKELSIEEVGEAYRQRLGDVVAKLMVDNEIDSAVLPYCQEDVLREHMKIPYSVSLRIASVACELRAEAFESVPGINHMTLELP